MYSLGPSEKKALVKKESALFFKTFRMYLLFFTEAKFCEVCLQSEGADGTTEQSEERGLRGRKAYNKGLLINVQKSTETTAPSLVPVPLQPGHEMTVDERNPRWVQCSTDPD